MFHNKRKIYTCYSTARCKKYTDSLMPTINYWRRQFKNCSIFKTRIRASLKRDRWSDRTLTRAGSSEVASTLRE